MKLHAHQARQAQQAQPVQQEKVQQAAGDSSADSSFDSSGAGAETAGDSPQGKSEVVQSRQDGGFYPTRGCVAQNERDKERDEETGR